MASDRSASTSSSSSSLSPSDHTVGTSPSWQRPSDFVQGSMNTDLLCLPALNGTEAEQKNSAKNPITARLNDKKISPKKKSSTSGSKKGNLSSNGDGLKHKRRYCKKPGCERIVKSQGLCQRHGAKPRKCRIPSCNKQAQGNFDGMCKAHHKAFQANSSSSTTTTATAATSTNPAMPTTYHRRQVTPPSGPPVPPQPLQPPAGTSVYDCIVPASLAWKAGNGTVMPLVAYLKQGYEQIKPPGWHRNDERRARGLLPVSSITIQELEEWERALVMTEILLLTGNAPADSYVHLAAAWAQLPGFEKDLVRHVCQHRGCTHVANSSTTQNPGSAPTTVGSWQQQPMTLYAATTANASQQYGGSVEQHSTTTMPNATAPSDTVNQSHEEAFNDSLEAEILNLAGCATTSSMGEFATVEPMATPQQLHNLFNNSTLLQQQQQPPQGRTQVLQMPPLPRPQWPTSQPNVQHCEVIDLQDE